MAVLVVAALTAIAFFAFGGDLNVKDKGSVDIRTPDVDVHKPDVNVNGDGS